MCRICMGSSFLGNMTIWRDIRTVHIKKYIRHGEKFVGNVTTGTFTSFFSTLIFNRANIFSSILNVPPQIFTSQRSLRCCLYLSISNQDYYMHFKFHFV